MKYIQRLFYYLRQHPRFQEEISFSCFPSDDAIRSCVGKNSRQTPFFCFDTSILHKRYAEALGVGLSYWKHVRFFYSFKTNYAPITVCKKLGIGAEVTSERELRMALTAGFQGKEIIYNGPHKSVESITLGVEKDVLFQVDSIDELYSLSRLARKRRQRVRFGLRLQVCVQGKLSRFGIPAQDFFNGTVLSTIKSGGTWIRFEGVHAHAGTDIDSVSIFNDVADQAGRVLEELYRGGVKPRYVNFGGGVTAHGRKPFSRNGWGQYAYKDYIVSLRKGLQRTYSGTSTLALYLEPGRYLVDDAAVFITKVLRVNRGMKQIVSVDGTTAMIPLVFYRPQIVRAFSTNLVPKVGKLFPTVAYGASCREDDLLFRGWLPALSPGDCLMYYVMGAYNQSLGADFIFDKPKWFFMDK